MSCAAGSGHIRMRMNKGARESKKSRKVTPTETNNSGKVQDVQDVCRTCVGRVQDVCRTCNKVFNVVKECRTCTKER